MFNSSQRNPSTASRNNYITFNNIIIYTYRMPYVHNICIHSIYNLIHTKLVLASRMRRRGVPHGVPPSESEL